MAGRPPNEALAIAKLAGDRTYEGSAHAKCGTTERYTSSGGCVHCARLKQAEMRDALTRVNSGEHVGEVEQELRLTPAPSGYKDPWD